MASGIPTTEEDGPVRNRRAVRRKGRRRFKYAVVNPDKIAWLRRQRCRCAHTDGEYCDYGGRNGSEAHHEGEPGERDDRLTLPLCAVGHHREGPHSRHVLGLEGFEAMHNLTMADEVAEYERRYESDGW